MQKTKGLKSGDPKEQDTIIGPLITEDAVATVKGRVDDVVEKGRRCSPVAMWTAGTRRRS